MKAEPEGEGTPNPCARETQGGVMWLFTVSHSAGTLLTLPIPWPSLPCSLCHSSCWDSTCHLLETTEGADILMPIRPENKFLHHWNVHSMKAGLLSFVLFWEQSIGSFYPSFWGTNLSKKNHKVQAEVVKKERKERRFWVVSYITCLYVVQGRWNQDKIRGREWETFYPNLIQHFK